jgi:hypothetical protein
MGLGGDAPQGSQGRTPTTLAFYCACIVPIPDHEVQAEWSGTNQHTAL